MHPFSDTTAVDAILRHAETILSPSLDAVGQRHASRIWGFMSSFVMLDRFSKTLGVADVYPGLHVPRKTCSIDYLGTGLKASNFLQIFLHLLDFQILEELNPPTKVLGKFLRTWGGREKAKAQYSQRALPVNENEPADIALTLSRRLIAVVKVKNILNIEAGLEMIALAMTISSEVRIFDMMVKLSFNISI